MVSISGFRLSNLPNCELLLGDLKISLLALVRNTASTIRADSDNHAWSYLCIERNWRTS